MTALIPIINIADFDNGSPTQHRAIADLVDAAARDVGFMQITGHGISQGVLTGLIRAMDTFFSLPLETKMRSRSPSTAINRGYTSPLSERLSYSAGVTSSADLFEAFNVGSTCHQFPHLALNPADYPDNVWPTALFDFQSDVSAWFAEAALVARRMTRIFELALDLPPHYFAPYQDHSLDVLRLNHYTLPTSLEGTRHKPVELAPEQMGMGAHTDYGIVTVLWADAVTPGLQIVNAAGCWVDVVPAQNALLINLGDLLARWTNDRWRSTLHRVLPSVTAEGEVVRRRSAAFFHDGNADAVIECLPSCTSSAHPPKYPAVRIADHIAQKLAGSRGLQVNTAAAVEAVRIQNAR
jgi:isopenicillin N synthase-like dioxygenase